MDSKFKENVPLQSFSNYRIGGKARYFFAAKSAEEAKSAVSYGKEMGLSIVILGGGTNLLISDKGFSGLVLKPEIEFLNRDGNKIIAGAGIDMSKLLNFAAENNLSGLEWAGGLPGTLGGAIRGNAGAFKGEIKDNLLSVKSLKLEDGKLIERNNAECEFGYRTSVFKKVGGEIILEAAFELRLGVKKDIFSAAKEKVDYRKAKQPLERPNIGSIFKNVPVEKFKNGLTEELKAHIKNDPVPLIPAAVLISQAGLKGVKSGGAQISEKHANFIINTGDAKASEVKNLIDLIRDKIKQKFGLELEIEVELVGDFD